MAGDFELWNGLTFGEWLYREICAEEFIERNGWAPESVKRVADRLQAGRDEDQQLEMVVPWIPIPTAFTGPGRYVYVTRRLLERCRHDEMIAFIVAHELAHHELGHVELFRGAFKGMSSTLAGKAALIVYWSVYKRLYGPEREMEADRTALELCLKAGYDGSRCLQIFDLLESFALDEGDIDMVYGPDVDSDEELSPDAPLKTKIQIWLWQRLRGYLPIRDRKAALLHHLQSLESEAPPVGGVAATRHPEERQGG